MQLALLYEGLVGWIVAHCPGPDKLAHTYAGLAIWLLTGWVFKKSLRSPVPLIGVAVCELANECVDRVAHGSWMWSDTVGDIAATLFWPTVITLLIGQSKYLSR
jgi:uncharacterized protein YqgC (DUF456 family)